MKKISKWPSRVINLLVVLAMVISLSAIVAPPIFAQEACNPTPPYDGCHLEVGVGTYLKVDGDFIPIPTTLVDDDGNSSTPMVPVPTVGVGDCFYVNAVVVNTGNATAVEPINATITLEPGLELAVPAEAGSHGVLIGSKIWGNGNLTSASPQGLVADFWWKVCCTAPDGMNTIKVNATSDSICDQRMPAEGCTRVYQGVTTVDKCPRVEIVEAPGMPSKARIMGNYTQTMPNPVAPCQNFGIKAEITNTCSSNYDNVLVHISWTGPASIVGADPLTWNIGYLAVGQTKAVGWTLHCDDPGDVVVTVDLPGFTNELLVDDPWIVHQEGGYGITVDITKPFCTIDECNPTCEIVQPTGDCGAENFTVEANIINNGDAAAVLVYAIVSVNPSSGWAQVTGSAIKGPFTLLPGAIQPVQYSMKCIGNGTGNVTVFASGADSVTGAPVSDDDVVTIRQTYLTAEPSPDPAYAIPAEVNKCQEFNVTFRYMNYSGSAWNDPSGGNITACIHWDRMDGTFTDNCGNPEPRKGNATLIDSVYFRRVVGGIPEAWILLSNNPAYGNQSIVVTGNDTVGYTSCMHIPVVCDCCGVEVRWRFQCTEVGPVKFWSRIDVQQTTPVMFFDWAVSKNVCVNQVWKAHLMADSFFFIQDDYGKMLMQEAVVPGTEFHLVIPVINTGDADAESVQVYFTLTDSPKPGCTKSFEILTNMVSGPFGDAASITPQGGGAYIAFIPVVPAHSAKKITLTLRCKCEGIVFVWVPDAVTAWSGAKGVRGYDSNTGVLVFQENIVVPPCPRELEQIPFTVVIENPHTCDTFTLGQTFPVKAKITNGATVALEEVYATLSWGPGDNVELVQLQGPQTAKKLVGNISAGTSTEITWELICTGDSHDNGEVYFTVTAESTDPLLTAISDDNPVLPGNQPVNVHQTAPPGACLNVYILSPGPNTWVATGQQFAVTAKVQNSDLNDTAEDVEVHIRDCSYGGVLHYVTLLDPAATQGPFDLDPGEFVIVSWTLRGGADHDFGMRDCESVNDTICVNATMSTQWSCSGSRTTAGDSVKVTVYPAAFLVTSIEDVTPDILSVGGLFTVDYIITNYGVADATSVVAGLSVNPAGAAVLAQTPDPEESMPRTIPGWTWGEPYNYIEGSFTLRCMQESPFTVTISPWGEDECGWHPKDPPNAYIWTTLPLAPIRFLGPASVTLEPGITGGAGCPDLTQMTINLNQNWNLMSLPLIPTGGSVTVAALFGGNISKVDAIWGYNGSWFSPSTLVDGQGYWVLMNAAATITETGKVNPMPPQTPPTYSVTMGWNLIGFKSTCARTASAYLAGVPWVRIWSFANGAWAPIQSGDMLLPGLGYWIAATGEGTIYP